MNTPAVAVRVGPEARRWGLLVPLLSSGALMALMYTAVSPVLSELAQHLPPGQDATLLAQVFMAMPSIGMMLGGVCSAWLVGRLGSRRLLLGGLLLYGTAGPAGFHANHVELLMASRLLLGLGAAAIATACTTTLAEQFVDADRRRYIGFQSSIGAGAGLLSTITAGGMAATLGWRAPFGLYLIGFLLLAVAAATMPSAAHLSAKTVSDVGVVPVETKAELPWRRLWPLFLLCLPLYAAVFMTMTQVPFLLRDDGVVDPVVQSWVLAMSSMWNAVGAALYGRVRQALGADHSFALGLALMSAGNVTLGLSHQALTTGLGCALAGAGAGLVVPHVPNMLIERVDGASRGRALGLMYSALYLGSFCNPLLMAPLVGWVGRHGALCASASLLLVCAAAAWWRGLNRRPS